MTLKTKPYNPLFLLNLTITYLCNQNTFKMAKNKEFKGYFEGDKPANSIITLSDITFLKIREQYLMKRFRIKDSSLTTLLLLVDEHFKKGSAVTVNALLTRHGYTKSFYYAVYDRLNILSDRGLVECSKSIGNRGWVMYFVPTEKAIESVYSLVS